VLRLLESEDPSFAEKANSFLERFSSRFQEMSNDIDPDVSAVAIALLAIFLEQGRLNEHDGENVPSMLWDAEASIRERAVQFVIADTFAEAAVDSSHEEDLNQLLNLFDRYLPDRQRDEARRVQVAEGKLRVGQQSLQEPMDTLVNGFWTKLPALQDYAALTKASIKLASAAADGKVAGKRVVADEDRQVRRHTRTQRHA
jgi:hypothetical protein